MLSQRSFFAIVAGSLFVLLGSDLRAQWRTERFPLTEGWQAIYLRVDTETRPIETLLSSYPQIGEVWRWKAEALDARILNDPSNPVSGVEWQVWKRDDRSNTNLSVLYPNSAYLVKVDSGSADFTLELKGKVVSPDIRWRTDGLNLLGFPTNADDPPTAEAFFEPAEVLEQQTELYGYVGGSLRLNVNPAQLAARFSEVERGKAYWIRSNKYADYDGPLRVRAAIGEGVDFGATRPTVRVVLTNRTDRDMDAILTPVASEAPPDDTTVPRTVPLTRRDNAGTGYIEFSGPVTVSLRANETLGMTLGIDRSKLSGSPGDQAFSLVKVEDSEGMSEFYVPARAEVASLAGLWVGEAEVTHVQNQLQRFQKEDGSYLVDSDGHYIPEYKKDSEGNALTDEDGNPIPEGDQGLNPTAHPFRLVLILHVDGAGIVRLLDRAYVGVVGEDGDGVPIVGVSTTQGALDPSRLGSASRVSAVHLPKGTNLQMNGTFGVGQQMSGTLQIGHADPNNPFIHAYHPDHDNLDPRFESPLPEGVESYRIERDIVLTLHSEPGSISDPSWGTTLLSGAYAETFSGLHKDSIAVEGVFALRRIVSDTQLFESD